MNTQKLKDLIDFAENDGKEVFVDYMPELEGVILGVHVGDTCYENQHLEADIEEALELRQAYEDDVHSAFAYYHG